MSRDEPGDMASWHGGTDGDTYSRVATAFHSRIDCIAGAVDLLAPGLRAAAALLTRAALEDRKVLVCADSTDAPLAELLTCALRAGRDGVPGLPALLLCAAARGGEASTTLWHDLRTLARDGDVLVCVDMQDDAQLASACARFASERNLEALTLSERSGHDGQVAVVLRADNRELRTELLLMAFHCLQDEIRHLLLGD